VKQWMCIRIRANSFINCLEYEWVVIAITDHKRYNAPVIKI
jgi:hypothetical protein